ncbi:MAG: hypothetical protein JXA98_03050 [Methanosarcinaceae archaeon]|nr:hypothetical protein [Methanosarcinaceae archaeon]
MGILTPWHTRRFKFTKRAFTGTHKVEALEAINMAVVEMVWDPPWTPERLEENGKETDGG